MRRLFHISQYTIRAALAVVLVGVLAFFALTRTEVGRDELRAEFERRFDAAFPGRIEVGALRGNLLYDLFASDVVLFDGAGEPVLRVDSVVVRPRWRSLLQRSFETRRLTLVRPVVHLVRRSDGTWNLPEALRPLAAADRSDGAPWAFETARVEIIDGTVTTRNLGARPAAIARGAVFDYAETAVTGVNARGLVAWSGEARTIELHHAHGALADLGLAVDTLAGRFRFEQDRLYAEQARVALGATHLGVEAEVDVAGLVAQRPDAYTALTLAGPVDFGALRAVFPALPLAADADVRVRLQGPLAALVVEDVALRRGRTHLHGGGTVLHLPDRLDLDVAFENNTADARDLAPLLPGQDFATLARLGHVTFSAAATGTATLARDVLPFDAAVRLDLRTDAGQVSGTLDVRRDREALRHQARLRFAEVDPGRVLGDPALAGRLNGRLRSEGTGTQPAALRGTIDLTLGPSHLAGRHLDSLVVDADVQRGVWRGGARLRAGTGSAVLRGVVDAAAAVPVYQATLQTHAFDLGPLLPSASLTTRLDAAFEVSGSGFSGTNLAGALSARIDAARISRAGTEEVLPPTAFAVHITPAADGTRRVAVTGDAVTAQIDGLRLDDGTAALARLWSAALQTSAHELLDKPYPRADPRGADAAFTLDIPDLPRTDVRILRAVAARSLGADAPVRRVDATITVHRPDVVRAVFPMLGGTEGQANARLRMTAGLDVLTIDAVATSDSFATSGVYFRRPRAEFKSQLSLTEVAEDRLTLLVGLEADTVVVRGRHLVAPRVLLRHGPGGGQLAASTGGTSDLRLRLDAALRLLPDRTRLTLSTLDVVAHDYAWQSARAGTIDLFSDAVAVDALRLVSGTSPEPQQLLLDGVFSSAPEDTVFLDIDAVRLRELSALAGLSRPVGGRMEGRLALTGGLQQPMLAGLLDVGALTFDDRLLGRLTVESHYVPGRPDVILDATLAPVQDDDPLREAWPPGLTETRNRMTLAGTVRLPDAVDRGGTLDLQLSARRSDLFFFEYLFPTLLDDVRGYATGTGHIAGSFRRPRFEADLTVREGAFEVPAFNLHYTAEGALRVDDAGIHIDEGRLADDDGGTARIDGHIFFNDYRYFSLDLHGRLDGIRIIDVASSAELPFYGNLRASGTATLQGPLSHAVLRAEDARTTADSEIFIPLTTGSAASDPGFIVFADSSGAQPDLRHLTERDNVLSQRPAGERTFLDGLEMDLAFYAPPGSTVHLVIDPLVGDVINAVGSGRIQLQRTEGEFATYGTFNVASGDYLFTAGDVFYRRFLLEGGTITWDGDPTNAALALSAAYRTRASRAGLQSSAGGSGLIPVVVRLNIAGRVSTPSVDLGLAIDRRDRDLVGNIEVLEAALNQPERATEYATSVLLTNSFLLTTDLTTATGTERADTRNQLAFTSLSGLVSSQVNRYLSQALPNLDLNFGLQGENAQDLDVTYGVALRLLDERLVIRGEGIYQTQRTERNPREFVVEVRLSPNVSVEVFYRRESDILSEGALTETTGAGLSYETQFSSWNQLLRRVMGLKDETPLPPAPDPPPATNGGE